MKVFWLIRLSRISVGSTCPKPMKVRPENHNEARRRRWLTRSCDNGTRGAYRQSSIVRRVSGPNFGLFGWCCVAQNDDFIRVQLCRCSRFVAWKGFTLFQVAELPDESWKHRSTSPVERYVVFSTQKPIGYENPSVFNRGSMRFHFLAGSVQSSSK